MRAARGETKATSIPPRVGCEAEFDTDTSTRPSERAGTTHATMEDERYFAPVTGERPKRQLRPDASAKFAPVTVRVWPAVEASAWEGVTDATICTHESVSRWQTIHRGWIEPGDMFGGSVNQCRDGVTLD